MNYQFRKKPIVIEAFQITKVTRHDNTDWPEWLNAAWQEDPSKDGSVHIMPGMGDTLGINTLEGTHECRIGDYIIRGINGELYPCKPDIFEKTYDAVLE